MPHVAKHSPAAADAERELLRRAKREKRKAKRAAKRAAQQQQTPGQQRLASEVKREVQQLRKAEASAGLSGGSRGGNGANFRNLLGSIIDPFNSEPVRYPITSGRETAINKIFTVEAAGAASDSGSGATQPLVPNCGFAVVRRDPRCATIKYDASNSARTSTYAAIFENSTSGLSGSFPGNNLAGQRVTPVKMIWTGVGFQRHGPEQYMWIDPDGVVRFWIDVEVSGTSTSIARFLGLAPTNSYVLSATVYRGGVVTEFITTQNASGSGEYFVTLPVGYPGYWAFQFKTAIGIAQTTVTFDVITNCPWSARHLALSQFSSQIQDLDRIRINSASVLYSDRTSAFITQGNIVTFQGTSEAWTNHVGFNTGAVGLGINNYSVVSGYNNAKKGPYKNGRYNFLKPTGEQDFEMLDLGDASGQYKYPPPISFEDEGDYLVVMFDASTIASGNAISGEWTFCYHVETETESQWRETKPPTINPVVMLDVFWVLAGASQDYENPKHLAQIWNWVRQNAGQLASVASSVIPLLPPQFQAPAAMAVGLGHQLLKRK